MIRRTLIIDNYTYSKIINMADYYNTSINKIIIELIQIGYIEKEKRILKNEK